MRWTESSNPSWSVWSAFLPKPSTDSCPHLSQQHKKTLVTPGIPKVLEALVSETRDSDQIESPKILPLPWSLRNSKGFLGAVSQEPEQRTNIYCSLMLTAAHCHGWTTWIFQSFFSALAWINAPTRGWNKAMPLLGTIHQGLYDKT